MKACCPYCRSADVNCTGADMPEWIGDDLIGTTEYYDCKECAGTFVFKGTYELAHGIYEDGNGEELMEE